MITQLHGRLFIINTELLDKLDIKVVAERQKQVAPLTTSLLRVAVGLDSVNDSVFDSDFRYREPERLVLHKCIHLLTKLSIIRQIGPAVFMLQNCQCHLATVGIIQGVIM